jgi:hypothetical protein
MRIAPDDLDALVAYLRSLRPAKQARVGLTPKPPVVRQGPRLH